MNYVKARLEELGKQIGLEKLKIDFKKATDDELITYCWRDVEILSEWFLKLIKWWKQNNLGKFGYTISQLAYNTYRHSFMKHKLLVHNNQEALELELQSYRGGRNECFKIGRYKGEFYKLDVNSMYPYVMYYPPYPIKLMKIINNPTPKQVEAYLLAYSLICKMNIEINEPAIAVKRDKLIFPKGRFTETLTTPEIQYVLNHGKIHRIDKCALYKHDYIFRDYVTYFYNMRQEAKKKGDTVTNQFAKLMLNSLYGKFAQRVREYIPIDYPAPIKWGSETFIDTETGIRFKVIYIDGKAYMLEKTPKLFRDAMISISTHITAYARMILWEYIKTAGLINVYYVDTDSLIVNKEGYENLKIFIGDELGQLKLEGIATEIEIIAPKWYRFGEETKIKGIRKEDEKINEYTYKHKRLAKTKTLLTKGEVNKVI